MKTSAEGTGAASETAVAVCSCRVRNYMTKESHSQVPNLEQRSKPEPHWFMLSLQRWVRERQAGVVPLYPGPIERPHTHILHREVKTKGPIS